MSDNNSINGYDVLSADRELRQELRESQFKVDELTNQLNGINKRLLDKDKQIEDLTKTVHQLRDKAYESVDLCEYEALKHEFDSTKSTLEMCKNEKNAFKTRLNTEMSEIELLHRKLDSQNKQINELSKTVADKQKLFDSQKQLNNDLVEYKYKCDEYSKLLDISNSRLSELTNLVEICRDEHLKSNYNDSNISFDGPFNESMSKIIPFNVSSSGECLSVVTDIKLFEVERALQEKCNQFDEICRKYKELENERDILKKEMNEKINELMNACNDIDNERQCVCEQNNQFVKQIEKYKQNTVECDAVIVDKNNEIQSLNNQLIQFQNELKLKVNAFEQLLVERNLQKQEIKRLEDYSYNYLEQKTIEINKLMEEVNEYKVLNNNSAENLVIVQKNFDEKCSELKNINCLYEELQKQLEVLTQEYEEKLNNLMNEYIVLESDKHSLFQQNNHILDENEIQKQKINDFIALIDEKESLIISCNTEMNELMQQLKQTESVCDQLLADNNSKKQEFIHLENGLNNNLEQKKQEIIKLDEELNEYKSMHQNLSKNMIEVEKNFEDKCVDYNRMFGLYEDLQKHLEILTQENEHKLNNLLNDNNMLEIEKKSLLEKIIQILHENDIQKQNIKECNVSIDQKECIINSCNTELKQLRQHLEETQRNFDQLLVEKNMQKEEFDNLENDLNRDLEKKKQETIKLDEELNEYKSMHQNLSKTLVEVNKKFEEKCVEYNRIFCLYEELQKQLEVLMQEYEEKLNNWMNDYNVLESEKQSLFELNSHFLKEIENQKQTIKEFVVSIDEKESLIVSCNTELNELQKHLDERETAFNELLIEKSLQKQQFDSLEALNQQTDKKVNDLTGNVLKFEQKIDEITIDCIRIENERQFLSQQNSEILNENEINKQKIEEYVAIVNSNESVINSLNADLKKFELIIDEKETAYNQLLSEINLQKENFEKLEFDSSNNLKQKSLENKNMEIEVNKYKDLVKEKDGKINELMNACNDIDNERQCVCEQNNQFVKQIEKYKQNTVECDAVIVEKNNEIQSLNNQLIQFQNELKLKVNAFEQILVERNLQKQEIKRLEDYSYNYSEQKTIEINKLMEELNEYKVLNNNSAETLVIVQKNFDEKCSELKNINCLYEELKKQLEVLTQEYEVKLNNWMNDYNVLESEKQSLLEQNNHFLKEIENLKQKIKEFVVSIDEKESLIVSCNTELNELHKHLDERETAFNELLIEKSLQKQQFDSLEVVLNSNLEQKTLENKKLENEVNEYKVLNNNSAETLVIVQKNFDEKCSELNNINCLYEELKKQLEVLTQEYEEKLNNLMNEYNVLESDKHSLLQQNNHILDENEIQKQKINDFIALIDEKESLIISFNTELKQLQQQLNERETVCDQLLIEKSLQKQQFDSLEVVLNSYLEQKTLEISKLDKKLDDYKAMHESSSETLLAIEKALEEKCMEYNRIFDLYEELQNRMIALNQQTDKKVNDLTENVLIFEQKIDELTIDCVHIENERQFLSQQNSEILIENEINKQKIEEYVAIVDSNESVINSLNADLKKFELIIDEKETAYNQLLSEINLQNENIKKLEIDSSNNLKQKLLENKKLENEVNEYKMISEKSREGLIEMQNIFDERVNQYKTKISKLNEQLNHKQQECDELVNNGKQIDRDVRQYEHYIEQYQQQINDLKRKLNIEEESFKMERIQKERYANENLKLEQQLNNYRLLLESKSANNVFVMPTTVNITTNGSDKVCASVTNDDSNQTNITNITNLSNQSGNISRRLPIGTGNRFIMADEEGEFMNPNNLIALKNGECNIEYDVYECDTHRMSTLQRRNTLLAPHLRTSYPVELAYCRNSSVNEDVIRSGQSFSQPMKPIENTSFHKKSVSSRKDASIVSEKISYKNYQNSSNIMTNENKHKSGSRMSLRSLTPQKLMKRVMNKQKWTPSKIV